MIYIIGDSHVLVFSGTHTKENGDRHIQPEYLMDDIHLSQQAMPLILEEFKDLI
jgi:hypothetical protein